MKLFKLNQPASTAEWTERIRILEAAAAEVGRALEQAREDLSRGRGSALIYGNGAVDLAPLESAAAKLEARSRDLAAGLELSKSEFQKAQNAEQAAQREQRQRTRDALKAEILKRAATVDELFQRAAFELAGIEALLREFSKAGGASLTRPLKWSVSHAAHASLRPYLELRVIGSAGADESLQHRLDVLLPAHERVAQAVALALPREPTAAESVVKSSA